MKSMNELIVVEEMISEVGVVSPTPYKEIYLLAKYYRYKGYSKKEAENLIFEILENKMDSFLKPQWEETVEKNVKIVYSNNLELVIIDNIYITSEELNIIHSLSDRKERKLLFTLICLARFNNLQKKVNYNSVTNKSSEVTKLSNIGGTTKSALNAVYFSLRTKGLIDFFGQGKDYGNIKVKCMNEESEVILEITKLDRLGNLIEDELKIMFDGYKRCECEDCGKVFKVKAKTKQPIYCSKECKKIVKASRERKKYHEQKRYTKK